MQFTIFLKVQSTFYPDFISKTVDILLLSSFITKKCRLYWYLMHLRCSFARKNVAYYALLRCKTFSLKIWRCKFFDKYHVWVQAKEKRLEEQTTKYLKPGRESTWGPENKIQSIPGQESNSQNTKKYLRSAILHIR